MVLPYYAEQGTLGRLNTVDLLVKKAYVEKKKVHFQLFRTSLYKEVNHTDPSPLVRIPCSVHQFTSALLCAILLNGTALFKWHGAVLIVHQNEEKEHINVEMTVAPTSQHLPRCHDYLSVNHFTNQ